MNRRGFFKSAGAALATGTLAVESGKSFAQSSAVSGNICAAASAAATQTQANYLASATAASDWQTLSSTLAILESNWTSQGVDAAMNPTYQAFNPSSVTSGAVPVAPLVAAMQQYQPSTTTAQVQNLLATVYSQPASTIQQVVASIQSNGMAQYIGLASNQALAVANAIRNPVPPPSSPTPVRPALYRPGQQPHLRMSAYMPASSCYDLAAAAALTTVAFMTISVMTLGAAPVLVGAAWAGIGFWGSIGAGTLTAGQFIRCS